MTEITEEQKELASKLQKANDLVFQLKVPGYILLDTLALLNASMQANARAVSFFRGVVDKVLEKIEITPEEPKAEEINEEIMESIPVEEEITPPPKPLTTEELQQKINEQVNSETI